MTKRIPQPTQAVRNAAGDLLLSVWTLIQNRVPTHCEKTGRPLKFEDFREQWADFLQHHLDEAKRNRNT